MSVDPTAFAVPRPTTPPRLMDQLHEAIRRRHFSPRTEEAYRYWIRQYIYFSGTRHPAGLGEAEVTAFLNHLAAKRKVAAATQNQALAAVLFLYKEVLGRELPWLDGLQRVSLNKVGRGVKSPLDRAEEPAPGYAGSRALRQTAFRATQ